MPIRDPQFATDLVRYPIKRIAAEARVTEPYWGRRFQRFRKRAILHRPGGIFGAHKMSIGADALIRRGCYLSVETATRGRDGAALDIDGPVVIQPYCMISATKSIIIENDAVIAAMTSTTERPSANVGSAFSVDPRDLAEAPPYSARLS